MAGTFRLLRNVTGLWLLHECRRAWAERGRRAHASTSSSRSPDGAAAALVHRPERRRLSRAGRHAGDGSASSAPATGQPAPASVGETVRCILESLALKHAQTVEVLAPRHRRRSRARSTSSAAARATSSSAGGRPTRPACPSLAGPEEATLLGNLLVQAIALGEIGSLAEARDVVRASFAPATVTSRRDRRTGTRRGERFAQLCDEPAVEVSA